VSTLTYAEFPNKLVRAANGVDYAYREAGDGGVPLVLLQHFRGNLDSWDPALIAALVSGRRVVTFDNTGVGGSSGKTPDTVGQMARDAIAFITALGLGQVDIPQARVKIYPDAAHGFLFQHHAEFAADVEAFLTDPR
jgi:pimeloyl-ACP methyl ester carboxylesterase